MRCLYELPDEQANALRKLSEETGVPAVHYVRQAIESYLSGQVPCGLLLSGNGQPVSGRILIVRVGR